MKKFLELSPAEQAAFERGERRIMRLLSAGFGAMILSLLIVSAIGGYPLINPFLGILMLLSCATFWSMGSLARREYPDPEDG